MERKTSPGKQTHPYSLICRICHDKAYGMNYSVISCMSCKMFFRRHAQSQLSGQRCQFHSDCQITPYTRKFCPPCRLKLCFVVGMDPQLIRRSCRGIRAVQLPKPTTVTLLDRDRSTLTLDEWNLLSNIINTYDEQNLFTRTKGFFKDQFSLPPKLRGRDSSVLNHIGSLFSTVYTFIERCPLFYSLPSDMRKILIARNLGAVGGYNGLYMSKEMDVFNNDTYSNFIDNIYGHGHANKAMQASERLDQNGILIKILLLLMIFSNNCTMISIDLSEAIHILSNPQILLQLENLVVTMLWKYLIYQYGFREGVLRYVCLVKSILDMIQRMGDGVDTQRHWNMVGNIVEEKTRSLGLEENLFTD